MYQALYRTWRPQVFEDVVGQKPITDTLRHEVSSDRLAHAYLFTGSRGTGKTTCSKILAKAVNCLHPVEGDPCGECENCIAISDGSMTDVLEIDAASNNSVEDVRALREEAIFAPATGKYRVYIIDEAHMLSKSAFNALLKIMEEPPNWVLFVLATTEVHKLPATILSRCQRFDFRRVSPTDIGNHLQKISEGEGISLEPEAAKLIGKIADGGMRDAISLLDQCAALNGTVDLQRVYQVAGLVDSGQISSLVEAILEGDTEALLSRISDLHNQSVDFRQLSENLLGYFRNLMVVKSVKNPENLLSATTEEKQILFENAEKTDLSQILYAIDVLQELYRRIGSDRSGVALFEMTMLKLSHPEYSEKREALSARISRLEAGQPIIPSGNYQKQTSSKPPIIEAEKREKEIRLPVAEDRVPPPVEEAEIPPPIDLPEPSPILSASMNVETVVEIEGELANWGEIITLIEKKNPPLHATLEGSKAFTKGDILLIDAENPVFFDLMRASEATKESLRNAIFKVTGKTYRLGPLKKGTKVQEKPKGIQALREAAQKNGIEIQEK